MKIWILSSETPHFQAGGIARYADNFARLAAEAGHAVKVIARGKASALRELAPGYQLVEFRDRQEESRQPVTVDQPDEHPGWPYNNMTPPAAASFQFSEVVEALIREEGAPDIIECQEYQAVGYFLLQKKLCGNPALENTPIVMHLHTPDCLVQRFNQYPRYKLPDYWIGRMELAAIRMADAVLAPSEFMTREIQQLLDGELPVIETIPYPLGPAGDGKADSALAGQTLVYAGRTELRKGLEPLLQTCDRLWKEGLDFRLELVGGDVPTPLKGGSLQAHFERKYRAHIDAGRLHFHGPQPQARCHEIMARAKAVLVPSLWENFPHTCMEAMALGKVVMASDSGGQAEMIGKDGKAGMLFSHQHLPGLEAAITRALALGEAEAREMGTRARMRIGDLCDPKRILEKRLRHFQEVISRHGPRRRFPFSNKRLREGPEAKALPDAPLVTVLIPYYNLGAYLPDALESALGSRYPNYEVLIVNDGSTDPGSMEVLEGVRADKHPRVRILDIPNGGLANARNVGVEAAGGELVVFLDADDRIGPDFISRAVALLQRYPNVHLAYSWVRYFDGGRGVWHSWNFDLPYLLCHNQLIPIAMIRRETFLRHGKNKPHIVYGLEDYESWISLAEAGCGGVAIPEALVEYRIRGDSMFKVIDPDKKLYLYDLISHEHPDLYKAYGLELFNLENANGPAYGWDQPTMFRAPQDRLMGQLERGETRRAELEKENARLSEAERWHQKELKRLHQAQGGDECKT